MWCAAPLGTTVRSQTPGQPPGGTAASGVSGAVSDCQQPGGQHGKRSGRLWGDGAEQRQLCGEQPRLGQRCDNRRRGSHLGGRDERHQRCGQRPQQPGGQHGRRLGWLWGGDGAEQRQLCGESAPLGTTVRSQTPGQSPGGTGRAGSAVRSATSTAWWAARQAIGLGIMG